MESDPHRPADERPATETDDDDPTETGVKSRPGVDMSTNAQRSGSGDDRRSIDGSGDDR